MKSKKQISSALLLLILCSFSFQGTAQDDLLEILQQEEDSGYGESVMATFKGTRLINGHTVELRAKNELDFIISHRFGRLNEGGYTLFGLDDASIRLGLDYGVSDRLNIGIGRSSFEKVYDGFIKYKLLRQGSGPGMSPFTAVAFASAAFTTVRSTNDLNLANRASYTWQLLLARKFNERLSLQLMPTLVHRNLVLTDAMDNDIFALGAGGRYKLSKRVALNLEYYYRFNHELEVGYHNALAIGFDIETGGHVFQLHLTNARVMQERGFITQTNGRLFDGDLHFGFNISRVFQL